MKNFGREICNSDDSYDKISRKSSESKHLINQEESRLDIAGEDYDSSEVLSSFSKTREEEKEVSLQDSNKTTLNSNFDQTTREKKFDIKKAKKKKNIVKNNGKFFISKKKFNF